MGEHLISWNEWRKSQGKKVYLPEVQLPEKEVEEDDFCQCNASTAIYSEELNCEFCKTCGLEIEGTRMPEKWEKLKGPKEDVIETWNFEDELKKTIEEKYGEEDVKLIAINGVPVESKIDRTLDEWVKIKGIGPKLAKKLVENGPYDSIKEISTVKGVSKTIIERIETTL